MLAVAIALGTAGALALSWQAGRPPGQAIRIGGEPAAAGSPWPQASPRPRPAGRPFVTSVAPGGRYFLDQYGQPILVRGDSPWSMMTRLSPDQARLWFDDRDRQGFNAAIISLVGATINGAPHADGSTFDGLLPFGDGDVLNWPEPYWERVTSYLRMAADHGITVFLYPIDGWTIGKTFMPTSYAQCEEFGRRVAARFQDLPNIVWMSGGDYVPATDDLAAGSDADHCIDAMMRGIRGSGDGRVFSIQLAGEKSISTENPFWASRVDWNFVYTYYPTYKAVLDAYRRTPTIPAVLGEANYEGENNQTESLPTTDETLRRQVLWALTSGAAGEFAGTRDWTFNTGWETRLSSPALSQIHRLRDLVGGLPWWRLAPDLDHPLVTGGRGTQVSTDAAMDVLDSDYVTAARTPDGSTALVYVPTARTITLDLATLRPGRRAVWVDPASGEHRVVPLTRSMATPSANDAGDHDWLLLLTSPADRLPAEG